MWTQLELFPSWTDKALGSARPSFKNDGNRTAPHPKESQRPTSELNRWLRHVGQMFLFGFSERVTYKGGTFEGLTIKKRKHGWIAVVKCNFKGKQYVAFENAHTLYMLITNLTLKKGEGGLKWKIDQFQAKA